MKYEEALESIKDKLPFTNGVIEEDEKEPDCYISNNDPYPLCKGDGEIKCRNCCWFEDYTEYHSPHPEEVIYELHVEEEVITNE